MKKYLSPENEYRLWVLLHHTRDVMFKAREKELRKYGITCMQSAVMFIIKANDGKATPSTIAKWLLRAPHTVSGILTRMERESLVKKTANSNVKGQMNVSLTERGEEVYRQTLQRKSIQEIMSCLPEQERKQLSLSLEKLRHESFRNLAIPEQIPFP